MCMGSQEDFFGGYDHLAQAGIVHVANHHISPGKKQWTWGNHEFGYAWDRNLTDRTQRRIRPLHRNHGRRLYRQPARLLLPPARRDQDLEPVSGIRSSRSARRSTRTSTPPSRSQRWPARITAGVKAQTRASVRLGALAVTKAIFRRQASCSAAASELGLAARCDLAARPGRSSVPTQAARRGSTRNGPATLRVTDADGREIIAYQPQAARRRAKSRRPPPNRRRRQTSPAPTSCTSPACTWSNIATPRAARRFTGARRCAATRWMRAATTRWACGISGAANSPQAETTSARPSSASPAATPIPTTASRLQPRPVPALNSDCSSKSEASRRPSHFAEAYAAFYKATWNQAWQCRRLSRAGGNGLPARGLADRRWTIWTVRCVSTRDNLARRNLKAMVLAEARPHGRGRGARRAKRSRWIRSTGGRGTCSAEPSTAICRRCLDLAHDCARAGLYAEAHSALLDQAVRANQRAARLARPKLGRLAAG